MKKTLRLLKCPSQGLSLLRGSLRRPQRCDRAIAPQFTMSFPPGGPWSPANSSPSWPSSPGWSGGCPGSSPTGDPAPGPVHGLDPSRLLPSHPVQLLGLREARCPSNGQGHVWEPCPSTRCPGSSTHVVCPANIHKPGLHARKTRRCVRRQKKRTLAWR